MGIFYYIPVSFGPYLSEFMLVLNNLSDLMALPEELFFKKSETEKMRSFNKISRDEISYNIVNSYSLFSMLYSLAFLLNMILKMVSYFVGRKIAFLEKRLKNIEFFIFEVCFAEITFFLSLSTIDTYDPDRYQSPKFIFAKILGTILLMKIAQELTQMVYLMASDFDPKNDKKAFYYSSFDDNFKPTAYKESRVVRLIEPFFRLKLIIFSILIASLQLYKQGALTILTLIQVGYTIYLAYILVFIRPFRSYLAIISMVSLECLITVFLLLLSIMTFYRSLLSKEEDSASYIELIIIFSSLLSLGLEVLVIIFTFIRDAYKSAKKWLKGKKTINQENKTPKDKVLKRLRFN